jgi:aryl sulfotransferase
MAWDALFVPDVSGRKLVRHVGRVYDSSRWEGFELRSDDIVISTPPKCGTTWTQMICALLIFQTPDLPDRLSDLSPWLDMLTPSRKSVIALLEAQEHRRFIKTHTPLAGIPVSDGVTYICVGRDPRDVALSMDDHLDNLDWDGFHTQRVAAALEDGLPEPPMASPPPLESLSEHERFWRWVEDESPPTESSSSLLRTVRHIESFWYARDTAVDVVMLHYHDLKTDLAVQMRALAARLGIEVTETRWPALVDAATFESMRRTSDRTTPSSGIWKDEPGFFKRGRSGAWRELLSSDDERRRYDERVSSLTAPDLAAWLHRS